MQMRSDVSFFIKRSLRSEDLPPTSVCLCHHIERANFQAFVCYKALVSLQNVPSPEGNLWKLDNNKLISVLMTRPPVLSGINELTTCRCTKSDCKRNCYCKMNNLACTEACLCMAADDGCCNPMNEYLFCDDSS